MKTVQTSDGNALDQPVDTPKRRRTHSAEVGEKPSSSPKQQAKKKLESAEGAAPSPEVAPIAAAEKIPAARKEQAQKKLDFDEIAAPVPEAAPNAGAETKPASRRRQAQKKSESAEGAAPGPEVAPVAAAETKPATDKEQALKKSDFAESEPVREVAPIAGAETKPAPRKRAAQKKSVSVESVGPVGEVATVVTAKSMPAAPPAPAPPASTPQPPDSARLFETARLSSPTGDDKHDAATASPEAALPDAEPALVRPAMLLLPILAVAGFLLIFFFIMAKEKGPAPIDEPPIIINAAAPASQPVPHRTVAAVEGKVPGVFGTLSEYAQLADAHADIELGNDLVPMPDTTPGRVESGLKWGVRANHVFDMLVHNPTDAPIAALLIDYSSSQCDTPPSNRRFLILRPPHPLKPDEQAMISADANEDLYSLGACISILTVYAPRS